MVSNEYQQNFSCPDRFSNFEVIKQTDRQAKQI